MKNESSLIYIGLGAHVSDSKRMFGVGSTTIHKMQCREYNRVMTIEWVYVLPTTKSKEQWDYWDNTALKAHMLAHYEQASPIWNADHMKGVCHQSRTNGWYMHPKSPREYHDEIVAVIMEKINEEINK